MGEKQEKAEREKGLGRREGRGSSKQGAESVMKIRVQHTGPSIMPVGTIVEKGWWGGEGAKKGKRNRKKMNKGGRDYTDRQGEIGKELARGKVTRIEKCKGEKEKGVKGGKRMRKGERRGERK